MKTGDNMNEYVNLRLMSVYNLLKLKKVDDSIIIDLIIEMNDEQIKKRNIPIFNPSSYIIKHNHENCDTENKKLKQYILENQTTYNKIARKSENNGIYDGVFGVLEFDEIHHFINIKMVTK